MTTSTIDVTIHQIEPHPQQALIKASKAKRRIVRAGRRSGKTVGAADEAVDRFLDGGRVLYAAPTSEQTDRFWTEVCRALAEPIAGKYLHKNETERVIEVAGTEQRIRAKTAWNADTLRGDYAELLILDEYQMMNESAWEDVGSPMLLDTDGDALFIYTPPSLISTGVSKARDPRHAAKLFIKAKANTTGRWEAFHFSSHENPHISSVALEDIIKDMSTDSYRREILALDDDDDLGRLVYKMFDERTQLIDPIPLSKELIRHTWHDFGSSNPAALFAAVDNSSNIYIYDEYLPGPGLSTFQHVEEFKSRMDGLIVLKRIGGNQTTEDEIRQGYSAHGWHIIAPKWAKPNKQLEIAFGLMERNRVFIFKNCIHLLNDIRNALWDVDKDGVRLDTILNEKRYHLLACLRYGLSDFTPETANSTGYGRRRIPA